jgi:hypothetical protein
MMQLTSVSADRLGGVLFLNRTDSEFGGLFGRDPAAAGFPPHTPNIMPIVSIKEIFS